MDGISKNRNFIMGLAIIWVALYHVPAHTSIPVLGFLQDIGYGGVDIFILLSGFGVYHSLNKDDNASSFLLRRLYRLLPSYLPFIIIWMVVRFISYQLFFTEICGNLTMTGWWNGDSNQFNWYVDGILLFYILSPYLYGMIIDKSATLMRYAILFVITIVISFAFLHGQLLMAMSRLPLFLLGMLMAHSMKDDSLKKLFDGVIATLFWNALMILGFVSMYYFLYLQDRLDRWHYGLWWYPFIMIVPGLAIDLGKIKIFQPVNKLLCMIGGASFEIFLWHLFIFETAQSKCVENKIVWILLFVMAFAIGIGYQKLVEIFMRRVKR